MNYVITTSEGESLQHHGILGQKWGVENGPPYPLDAKDHSANEVKEGYKKSLSGGRNEHLYERNRKEERRQKKEENKQKRTDALKQHYMDLGQTEEQAAQSAETYKKLMKGLAIAGATAVLAGGAIYAYSKLDKYGKDFVIKKGQSIYRVASQDSDKLHDVFYATPDKMDFKKYIADWGIKGRTYKAGKEFAATRDLKIASDKTARELYKELLKDSEFSKEASAIIKSHSHLRPAGTGDYELFNTFAPLQRGQSQKAFTMYKEFLQKQGYDGVIDFNDKYGVGYGTKAPVIFFANKQNPLNGANPIENFSLKSIDKLDGKKIALAKIEYNNLLAKEQTMNNFLNEAPTMALQAAVSMLGIAGLQAVALEDMKNNFEVKTKENSK